MCKINEFKIARRDFDDAVVLWNAVFAEKYRNADSFELNCYYQLFKERL